MTSETGTVRQGSYLSRFIGQEVAPGHSVECAGCCGVVGPVPSATLDKRPLRERTFREYGMASFHVNCQLPTANCQLPTPNSQRPSSNSQSGWVVPCGKFVRSGHVEANFTHLLRTIPFGSWKLEVGSWKLGVGIFSKRRPHVAHHRETGGGPSINNSPLGNRPALPIVEATGGNIALHHPQMHGLSWRSAGDPFARRL